MSAAPRISSSGSLRGDSGGESSERQTAARAAVAGSGWGGTGGLGGELGVGDAETCEWGAVNATAGSHLGGGGSPAARRGGDSCGGGRRLSRVREAPLQHPAVSRPEPLSVSALCLWANFVLCWGRGPAGWGAVRGGGPEREGSLFFTLPRLLAFSISSALRLPAALAKATAPHPAVGMCYAAPNRAD